MKQIINLHFGQAGIQIASECWELFCLEHGIEPDGSQGSEQQTSIKHTFFEEFRDGKNFARSVMMDFEPMVIDEVKTGKYRDIFAIKTLLSDKEDCADNYARGYHAIGPKKLDEWSDRIRWLVEQCQTLEGFILTHSIGGGTGSGFVSRLLCRLTDSYSKKAKINFTVYPSMGYGGPVEPYNAVLATDNLLQHSSLVTIFDNRALYRIMSQSLKIENPNYSSINRLIAQVISSFTSPSRFSGITRENINGFLTNLVPYHRIKFVFPSFAPMLPIQSIYQENKPTSQITNEAFLPDSTMASVDPTCAKYISSLLLYRGDVTPKQAIQAAQNVKSQSTVRFVDWSPSGLKLCLSSISHQTPPNSELSPSLRSLCAISNTEALTQILCRLDHKFDLTYSKRAFVHWYVGQGMEELEFSEARENLAALEKDFQQCHCCQQGWEEE